MADGTTGPESPARLTPVTAPVTRTPPLPPELAPQPEDVPDLLAALDAGDELAVRAWVRAHTPEPESLLLYGLYVTAGVTGLVEWPAALLAMLAQLIVDRRFGGVEKLAAELRARIEGVLPAR
jgi:hypothetical protein